MKDLLNRRKAVADAVVRDGIGDAAVQVLGDHDLPGFTMDAVAAVAGVSKGTLYNYFRNKDELLIAVHGRLFGSIEAVLDELLADSKSPVVTLLEQIICIILEHVEQNRSTLWILDKAGRECRALHEHKERDIKEFIDDLAGLLQRGIERGELKDQDAWTSAWFVYGAMAHACLHPVDHPDVCPAVDRLPRTLTAFVLHGVTGEETK